VEAEERGQAEAIARSTQACLELGVPMVATIVGEGGSGGAVALAIAICRAVGRRVEKGHHAVQAGRAFHHWLQSFLVNLLKNRKHDKQRQKEAQTNQHLVRRHLLGSQGLAQEMKYHYEAGKRGHQDEDSRCQRQDGQQQQNL